jgi:hypothetical protein
MRTVNVGDRFLLPAKHTHRKIRSDPKINIVFTVIQLANSWCLLEGTLPNGNTQVVDANTAGLNAVLAGNDGYIWKLLRVVTYKNKERVLWRR